ncbi:MAG TPA: hypothetical protein VFG50_06760 [Rhodothermales bacterium]|nr:hypothetical protein [Rhodothermales bacterium]
MRTDDHKGAAARALPSHGRNLYAAMDLVYLTPSHLEDVQAPSLARSLSVYREAVALLSPPIDPTEAMLKMQFAQAAERIAEELQRRGGVTA